MNYPDGRKLRLRGPRATKALKGWVVAVLLAVWAAGTSLATAAPAKSGAPVTARLADGRASDGRAQKRADSANYAQREQSAQQLEQWKGGSASIYIGGSALTIALLIVLLIVLL